MTLVRTQQRVWLSVIVLCPNRDRWLRTALQSLADQNDTGIEVIAVDSSADDACWRAIDSFSGILNIRGERRPLLISQADKVNFGVTLAGADHVCILHDDDLWAEGRARTVKEWLVLDPPAALYLHPSYIIDEFGKELGIWRCPLVPDRLLCSESLLRRLLVQNFISSPAPTFRRDAFLSTGGMDGHLWYAPDWDLWLKIAAFGATRYFSAPLTYYRIHDSSVTSLATKDITEFQRQHEIVMRRHLPKLDEPAQSEVLPLARASIIVNAALAAAARGNYTDLAKAACSLAALGPKGMRQYLTISRIVERTFPRARAFAAGRLFHEQRQR